MSGLQSLIVLIGRILLSGIFLASGIQKVMSWPATAEGMEKEGMAAVPFFLVMAILFEVGGALCVLLGWYARFGAVLLIAFLIPVTLIYHDFWQYQDAQQQQQMAHFMKNVTIMGGLLVLLACGAGRFSAGKHRNRHSAR